MTAPLAGICVIDAVVGPLAPITRYLAELGARVERFAPADDGLRDFTANVGKVWCGRTPTVDAMTRAHVVVSSADDLASLRNGRPSLVTMTVSDFGSGNSISRWQASGAILHALSGELSRSGIRGRAPLLPPGDLAFQCAAAQAAFALVAGLYRALSGGGGAHYDFSALEGAVQALDPGYGISGSATMGKPAGLLSRDRPAPGFQYPILPCADGFVRICLLARRQWRGMFTWLGEPEQFAAPEFDDIVHRYRSRELIPYIATYFASRTRHQLECEGQRHGVPISAVMSLNEFVTSDQVAARHALTTFSGVCVPNGVLSIDGQRMGPSEPAGRVIGSAPAAATNAAPLAGLKVLDLGIIVVGAEQGRLLADLGADVVKVESRAFPDGNRQSYLAHGMSVSFAAGHRNKRSLGLDLRHPEGRALFLDLVGQADVLCSNFKPHTLEKLGLGPDVLAAANPRLIMSESSAFGGSGPWQERMGYGPLVRAATGLTLAWRYPDDPRSFSDSITIYPDHVAGRIAAMGVIALLIRRQRTGAGGRSEMSQAEVMLSHFATHVAALGRAVDDPALTYVLPAKGDDEWCVVTVADKAQRAALSALLLVKDSAADLEVPLRAWLTGYTPLEAATLLQDAGIPAAPMLRLADLPGFAYYVERGFYRVESHPWMRERVIAENYVAASPDVPAPSARPAPLAGEQTAEVIADWLGLAPTAIDALCRSGVLEPLSPDIRAAAESHIAEAA